jgi:proline iminopeptidase
MDAARLYVREVGRGVPVLVLHGGPDFNQEYLLPELDELADSCRLIYYDQRGRGRSYSGQTADDVSLDSELEDIDRIRGHVGADTVALLGHSWGGLLAVEYATRRSRDVSHLVLMNTAPASHTGAIALREALAGQRSIEERGRLSALRADPRYRAGDVDIDLEYYRIHFRAGLQDREQLERLLSRLRRAFTAESVVAARAIEDRLYEQTWDAEGYDLLPRLGRLAVPTLVIHGERDFVPLEIARDIADAIPRSQFLVLADCGHFAYLERPDRVHAAVATFLAHV